MTGYHSYTVRPSGYKHSECFVEVARAVDDALKALNAYDASGTSIVFGAHLDRRIPKDAIVFNSEQVFFWDYRQTLQTHRVWDYSRSNIDTLAKHGIKAEHCSIGYMPNMTYIRPATKQDIEVLFIGSINDRRARIIQQLRDVNINTLPVFDLYGEARDNLIARSKIILNIHFYEEAIHEIFRTSHLMANRKCVVSEIGKDKRLEEPLRMGPLFVEYDLLADTCKKILAYGQETIDDFGEESFKVFSKTSMVESLRGLI